MLLERITLSDISFVFDCLVALRGDALYDEREFKRYLEINGLFNPGPFSILVGREAGERVGMLTCNRFSIPRYLGFGIEIEEVVVHPRYQGKGVAGRMMNEMIAMLSLDTSVRKVIVKTDDVQRAGKVYGKLFSFSDQIIYTKAINRL
jgi:GNAT superfamily N-acetyltransferase